jgi:hypothetical protein
MLSGSESGDWYIDLKTGQGSAGQGKPPSAADATLTMDSKDFFDMFSGKIILLKTQVHFSPSCSYQGCTNSQIFIYNFVLDGAL